MNVSCIATYTLSSIFFMYDNDGNTETDRTGAAQDYHLTICILILRNFRRPPPNPMMYIVYARPMVTTCLYTSALLVAELGSCLHP